jgi:hypothetical protein
MGISAAAAIVAGVVGWLMIEGKPKQGRSGA